jgi:hypothetical protein
MESPLHGWKGERRDTRRQSRRSAVHSHRVRGPTLTCSKLGPPLAVSVALALTAIGCACGGDDEKSDSGSTGPQPQAGTETSPRDAGGPPRAKRDGSTSGRQGSGGRDAPAGDGTGGAGAPRTGDAVHRKSLARFLARRYAQSPWYPLVRRMTVRGGVVRIYLNFPPESDDENPPQLACSAVLSYGRRVREVFVYGSATPQARTVILKRC